MSRRPPRRFGAASATVVALSVLLTGITAPVASVAASPTSDAACTSMTLSAARERILADVNAARKKAHAKPLKANSHIDSVAQKWSRKQAAASPGGQVVTVKASARSAKVTGLKKGVSYTFTVKAKNAYGSSPTSARTRSVKPGQ